MSRPARRTLFAPALAALLTIAPACSASAGHKWGQGLGLRSDPTATNRSAMRPTGSPLARTRPLYLSGYAGENYGPGGAASPLNPTGYRVRTRGGCPTGCGHPGHGR